MCIAFGLTCDETRVQVHCWLDGPETQCLIQNLGKS